MYRRAARWFIAESCPLCRGSTFDIRSIGAIVSVLSSSAAVHAQRTRYSSRAWKGQADAHGSIPFTIHVAVSRGRWSNRHRHRVREGEYQNEGRVVLQTARNSYGGMLSGLSCCRDASWRRGEGRKQRNNIQIKNRLKHKCVRRDLWWEIPDVFAVGYAPQLEL